MPEEVYTYAYPRPMVTVDVVLFADRAGQHSVLLIQRGRDPYKDNWALPGGFVEMDEPLSIAAARELQEETGLHDIPLRQLHTFGAPGRDPRGHTISVAYVGEVPEEVPVTGNDDAAEAQWFMLDALPPLAFDHDQILKHALFVHFQETL